jgi:hypothetical protein
MAAFDGPGTRSLLVAIRRVSRARPGQEASMEFFCDVSRLDGVLIDDPVVTAAMDDEPIAMLLVGRQS